MSTEGDKPNDQEIIAQLAAMPPMEYDRIRKGKATEMGTRVSTLDMLVERARPDANREVGFERIVEEIEPWPEPVNGIDLANQISTTLTQHMVLPPGAPAAISLWMIGSYYMDVWRVWPKILVTSPRMRCGKSTHCAHGDKHG